MSLFILPCSFPSTEWNFVSISTINQYNMKFISEFPDPNNKLLPQPLCGRTVIGKTRLFLDGLLLLGLISAVTHVFEFNAVSTKKLSAAFLHFSDSATNRLRIWFCATQFHNPSAKKCEFLLQTTQSKYTTLNRPQEFGLAGNRMESQQ